MEQKSVRAAIPSVTEALLVPTEQNMLQQAILQSKRDQKEKEDKILYNAIVQNFKDNRPEKRMRAARSRFLDQIENKRASAEAQRATPSAK